MRTPRAWIAVGIACVALVLAVYAAKQALRNELVVVNQSGEELIDVTIRVGGGGSVHEFASVPDGSQCRAFFRIASDGDFQVSATASGGEEVRGSGGYVTGGMYRERVRIVVGPGGVVDVVQ